MNFYFLENTPQIPGKCFRKKIPLCKLYVRIPQETIGPIFGNISKLYKSGWIMFLFGGDRANLTGGSEVGIRRKTNQVLTSCGFSCLRDVPNIPIHSQRLLRTFFYLIELRNMFMVKINSMIVIALLRR